MNKEEHLNINQIAGYYTGKFAERELCEIGRHLLICDSCRALLPAPSAENFLLALMKENAVENSSSPEKVKFSSVPFRPSISAFSFAALVVFFSVGLIYFIFLSRADTDLTGQMNTLNGSVETARLENKPEIVATTDANQTSVQKTPAPVVKNPRRAQSRKLSAPAAKNQTPAGSTGNKQNDGQVETVALVRGGTNPAVENKSDAVDAKISVSGDRLKLTWSKSSQSARYSVVVVDADSNELIDEIKLEDQTAALISFKKYEKSKKYEIRVVAVSDDGTIRTSKTFTFTKKLRKK